MSVTVIQGPVLQRADGTSYNTFQVSDGDNLPFLQFPANTNGLPEDNWANSFADRLNGISVSVAQIIATACAARPSLASNTTDGPKVNGILSDIANQAAADNPARLTLATGDTKSLVGYRASQFATALTDEFRAGLNKTQLFVLDAFEADLAVRGIRHQLNNTVQPEASETLDLFQAVMTQLGIPWSKDQIAKAKSQKPSAPVAVNGPPMSPAELAAKLQAVTRPETGTSTLMVLGEAPATPEAPESN
jgi:hypothetical protein